MLGGAKIPEDSRKIMAIQLASRPNGSKLMCPNIADLDISIIAEKSSELHSSSGPDGNKSFLNALFSSTSFKNLFEGESSVEQPQSLTASMFRSAQSILELPSYFTRSNTYLNDISYFSPASSTHASCDSSPVPSRPLSRASSVDQFFEQSLNFAILNNMFQQISSCTDHEGREERFQKLVKSVRYVFSHIETLSDSFAAKNVTPSESQTRPGFVFGMDLEDLRKSYALIIDSQDDILDKDERKTLQDTLTSSLELVLTKFHSRCAHWRMDGFIEKRGNRNRSDSDSPANTLRDKQQKKIINRVAAESLSFSTDLSDRTVVNMHLRCAAVILEFPLLNKYQYYESVTKKLAICLSRLHRSVKKHFVGHLARAYIQDPEGFRFIVLSYREVICLRFNLTAIKSHDDGSSPQKQKVEEDGLVASVRVFSLLYNVNEFGGRLRQKEGYESLPQLDGFPIRTIIPFWSFYITSAPSFAVIEGEEDNEFQGPYLSNLPMKQLYFNYLQHRTKQNSVNIAFSLLNYPFTLDPISKTRIIRIESVSWMSSEFEEAFVRQGFLGTLKRVVDGVQNTALTEVSPTESISSQENTEASESRMSTAQHQSSLAQVSSTLVQIESAYSNSTNPYFLLEIDRSTIVNDTFNQIQQKWADLHKPLKIRFLNEDGVDQGGVQKEFFQLIFTELLEPEHGLFTYDESTRFIWLNPFSLEPVTSFLLFGVLLGLAVYNGVMIDVNLPLIFYKKLLYEPNIDENELSEFVDSLNRGTARTEGTEEFVTIDDMMQLHPETAKGLLSLLDWDIELGDVADIFCNTFEISYQGYGEVKNYPLIPNGASVEVGNDNRDQFVKLYIHHILVDIVKPVFQPLHEGFWRVVGGPEYLKLSLKQDKMDKASIDKANFTSSISFFRPEELQILMTGLSGKSHHESLYSPTAFKTLAEYAQYDDFRKDSKFINWFWDIVLNEFTDLQRRKLLWFVTASDRVPLGGLKKVVFVLQRNGSDVDRLPSASTCFSRLLLPEYSSKMKLKTMLATAIEESKGFGLL